MACLRMTLLRPRPGATADVQALLEELDASLAGSEGLLLSFVTGVESNRLGRVSFWQSKDAANREATRDHVLSLRSRLRFLSAETQEVLMEVKSGHVTADLDSILAGGLDSHHRLGAGGARGGLSDNTTPFRTSIEGNGTRGRGLEGRHLGT